VRNKSPSLCIETQVCSSSFQAGEKSDHHLDGAFSADGDEYIAPDAVFS
jgi:hypothetical protein